MLFRSAEEARPQSVAQFKAALQGASTSVASQATILVTPTPVPAAPATASAASASIPTFDADTLRRLTTALAAHVGPIAATVVKSSARKTATLIELVEKLAKEVGDEKERAAFVKANLPQDKSTPTGKPVHTPTQPASAPTQPTSVTSRFDPAILAKAEQELARYIGAVARVVVRRAAAKAKDEAELYLLLADEIEDKDQKKTFIRKAMSVSGRE